MNLKDRIRKLLGAEPVSNSENWRRAMVRNGNLDWQGLPIDRPRQGETPVERPRGYFEQVSDFLGRAGLKIEQRWNPDIPVLHPNQFQHDAATIEAARERMGARRNESNTDALR
jgi:hypothetical protein